MALRTLTGILDRAAGLHAHGGIVDLDGTMMYWGEAEMAAKSLARNLIGSGVKPGDRIAVLHPKSTRSFLAVHASIMAGAVMVPLDPMGPPAHINHVLATTEPAAIVGTARVLGSRAIDYLTTSSTIVFASGSMEDLIDAGVGPDRLLELETALRSSTSNPLPSVEPEDSAYIIFTSGSTGVPKGIVHTHASAMAYAEAAVTYHGLVPSDRLAGTSPLHFDMSTLELYGIPFAGATAISISEVELNFPASLVKRIEAEQVTVLYAVPYQLRQMQERGDLGSRNLASLRQISFGGEAFAPGVLESLSLAFPPAELLNVYGPAEVNGVVTHSFGTRPTAIADVPIGRPWPGVSVLVVDDQGAEVVAGAAGELLVASPSAMQGYWRRAELNRECFVDRDGVTYYRTGDLVSRADSGTLRFHGRADNRVKVRGVRIELEEIERVLSDAPGVAHAVAGRAEGVGGSQHIAAWIVAHDSTLTMATLVDWCRPRLPPSAVPTEIRFLSEVPVTATGKIDRKSLRDSLAKFP